jgi:K319L-like, PKD domain
MNSQSSFRRARCAAGRILGVWALLSVLAWAQNQAPQISIAGLANLSPANPVAQLSATVTDDGLPFGELEIWWEKFSGPGPVVFEDQASPSTTAYFDVAGDYELRLTVKDGALKSVGTVTVTLGEPPLPIIVQNILDASGANGLDPLFVDRFLTLVPGSDPAVSTGAQYYAAVDPLGQKTTFSAWKAINGFPVGGVSPIQVTDAPGAIGCCASAVYKNAADLGFGRRMVMSRNGGDIAFFVTNYFETDATVSEDPAQLILTVAMEYSAYPGDNPENRYVKFYMFDPAGNRITDVDFDGRGPKPVPTACIVCHGGAYNADGSIPTHGDMGALYLPFDITSFDFPTDPDFKLANQEAALREMNQAVLDSDVPIAIRELIEGWYGGFGLPNPTQNREFVVPGWKADPELYRSVVAKSCRMCHVARPTGTTDFNSMSDFMLLGPSLFQQIYGPTPAGFRMPHAKETFERFWLSTSPNQPALLASAFDATNSFVGLGAPDFRVFVNPDAASPGAGSSWDTAFTTLTAALAAAATPNSGIEEIWVKAGVYSPALEAGGGSASTYNLPSGLRLYGGFAGTEASLDERNIEDNETVISGDIAGDDDDHAFGGHAENVQHLITANATGSGTRVDGFTLRGGNAQSATDTHGGAALVTGGALTFARCLFHVNLAVNGGAIAVDGGSLTLRLCRFNENRGDDFGGAIYLVNGAELDCENTEFHHNEVLVAGSRGGAIAQFGGELRLVNSTLHRNYAEVSGGALFHTAGATALVANSLFWGNCGVNNDEPGQIAIDDAGGAVAFSIDRSIVQNLTGALGGVGNSSSDPLFVDPLGPDGILGTLDEDFQLMEGSPAIDLGDAGFLRPDFLDLDFDDNLAEDSPVDLLGSMRRIDDILSVDALPGQRPAVDAGCFEYALPAVTDVALGTVGTNFGAPPEQIYRVNGELGGAAHRVDIGLNQPFAMSMDLPASMGGVGFAPFALFMRIGVPTPEQAFIMPLGIGFTLFHPAPLAPFATDVNVVLTDNIGLGAGQLFGSTPAPWNANFPPQTITDPLDVTIQGLIVDLDSPSPSLPVSVTNGLVVSFRENIAGNNEPMVTVENTIVACPGFPVAISATIFDPDVGDPLNIQWTQVVSPGDPEPVLTGANTATLSFTAPALPTTLVFELMVDDGFAFAPTQTVTVLVGGDGPPVAVAGENQVVGLGDMVTLDGTASCDPDGGTGNGVASYAWTQIITGSEPVVLAASSLAAPTFSAPGTSELLTFQLVVTDEEGLMSDPVLVTVRVCTTYADDVDSFFQTPQSAHVGGTLACTACHADDPANDPGVFPNPPLGIDFSQSTVAARHQFIVNTSGIVNTANPANSVLLNAMLVSPGGGMPQFFQNTSDPRYRLLLDWISDGAPLNLADCVVD